MLRRIVAKVLHRKESKAPEMSLDLERARLRELKAQYMLQVAIDNTSDPTHLAVQNMVHELEGRHVVRG